MRKYLFQFVILGVTAITAGSFAGVSKAEAAIGYNGGAYVNLCGTGTAATAYSCTASCNPATGSCTGTNNGAVKYVCSGRWDQCFEAESYWSNNVEIGNQACGKTVQLSVFDKTCRLEDGTWDSTCRLLGYMVWYSGDCWSGVGPTPTPFAGGSLSSSPTPTVRAATTVAPTSRLNPNLTTTPTRVPTITPTGTVLSCGKSCVMQSDCGAGSTCYQGSCRNPSCRSETSCVCPLDRVATGSGTQSPETGGEMVVLLVIPGLIGAGWMARRYATKVW